MKRILPPTLVAALCFLVAFLPRVQADGAATLSIQVDQPGVVVASNLFGIFFEEINYGGDGGLYAELVRNRSFQQSANPELWTQSTQGIRPRSMLLVAFVCSVKHR